MIDLCLGLGILFVVVGMAMNLNAQNNVNVEIIKPESIQPVVLGKININTAGLAELDSLPGIGEITAKKIIDYRSFYGSFKKIEDLQKVGGIGAKKYADIASKISI